MKEFVALVVAAACVGATLASVASETKKDEPNSRQDPAPKKRSFLLDPLDMFGTFMLHEWSNDLDELLGLLGAPDPSKKRETLPENSIESEKETTRALDPKDSKPKPADPKASDSKAKSITKKPTTQRNASTTNTKSTQGETKPKTEVPIRETSLLQQRRVLLTVLGLALVAGLACFITHKRQQKVKWQ